MIALISLFVIILVSIIVVRIGAIALELTGIPSEVAAFQAQSAFSGTGFTTSEAEAIVNHPARRKIVRILIMFGSAGLTSSIATLIMAFVGQSGLELTYRGALLFIGLIAVFFFARSRFIYQFMKRIIMRVLRKYTSLTVVDYHEILGLGQGYGISKFGVKEGSWLIGKPLKSLGIRQEGILILTIRRRVGNRNELIGAPTADVVLQAGDELVCYGKVEGIKHLSKRLKGAEGDRQHDHTVTLEKVVAENESVALQGGRRSA